MVQAITGVMWRWGVTWRWGIMVCDNWGDVACDEGHVVVM